MDEGKHTPGPWRTGREDMQSYDGLTGEPFSSVYADSERGKMHMGERLPLLIAHVPGSEIGRDEEKANARLIAAAPEMKEALEELGGWFDGPADWSDSDLGNWVRKHLWRKVAPILRKATLPASGGAS